MENEFVPRKICPRWILATLLAIVLSGSLGWAKQNVDQVRKKWIGKHIDKLVAVHGYPDDTIKAPNGNQVYVFVKNIEKFYPVAVYHPSTERQIDIYEPRTGTYSHGYSTQKDRISFEHRKVRTECAGYFEVDQQKRIVNIRFKGQSCPQESS